MLSRAASSLFWMARYLERAETQARLLDVSLTMALIDVPEDREEQLSVPLLVTGSRETFHELYPEITPQNLIDFLLLDDRLRLRGHRDDLVLVEGRLLEAAARVLVLQVGGGLADDLEVVVLEALADLEQCVQALLAHVGVLVLQEADDVLRDAQVEAGLDLVGVARLED